MKLLQAGASPFVRKARIAIIEAGLEDQVEMVAVTASPKAPVATITDQNPLGKIPCLIMDDGNALFDSRAITRYLDAKGSSDLYPKDAWHVLTLESMGDGIMDAAVAMVYEKRFRPPELVFEDFLDWQWMKITRTLDALEKAWTQHLGKDFTAGHIAVACALGYLDFRHADRDWRSGRPGLTAWKENIRQRPSIAATVPTD